MVSAVKKIPGVSSAQLVSRDAFLENFSKYFPQLSSDLASLDADSVPRYVKVRVKGEDEPEVQERLGSSRASSWSSSTKPVLAG